jgi:hypothetical protein
MFFNNCQVGEVNMSPDGITWTKIFLPDFEGIISAAYENGYFIGIGMTRIVQIVP